MGDCLNGVARLSGLLILNLVRVTPGWWVLLLSVSILVFVSWCLAALSVYLSLPAPPPGDGWFHMERVALGGVKVLLGSPGGMGWLAGSAIILVRLTAVGLVLGVGLLLLWKQLSLWALNRLDQFMLVFGEGVEARRFLSGQHGRGGHAMAGLAEEEMVQESIFARRRVPWLAGEALQKRLSTILSRGQHRVLLLADQSDTRNVAFLEQVLRTCEAHPPGGRVRILLRIIDSRLRRQLSERLQQRNISSAIQISLFSDAELRARLACRVMPAQFFSRAGQGGPAHLVVAGGGAAAEVMAVQLYKTMVLPPGMALKITVLDPDASKLEQDFALRYPEVDRFGDLEFADLDTGSADEWRIWIGARDEEGLAPTGFYVAGDDDARDLGCALALAEAYQVAGKLMPPACLLQAGESGLVQADLPTLIALDSVAMLEHGELVVQGRLDAQAAHVHNGYLQDCLNGGEQIGDRPSLYYWDELPEMFREENRDQAEHNVQKLRLMGLAEGPKVRGKKPPEAANCDNGDVVEALSIAEHDRWLASRYARNWVYAPTRDDAAREHPDMVSWEELPEPRRDIDRAMIRQLPALMAEMGMLLQPVVYCLLRRESGAPSLKQCLQVIHDSCPGARPTVLINPLTELGQQVLTEWVKPGLADLVVLLPDEVRPEEAGRLHQSVMRASAVVADCDMPDPRALKECMPALIQQWLMVELDEQGGCSVERLQQEHVALEVSRATE